jgi:hypothetical protein
MTPGPGRRRRGWAAALVLLALGAGAEDGAYDAALETLARELEARAENRELSERVAARAREARADLGAVRGSVTAALERQGLVPLRVPGLYWRSHPETGADLAVLETWLGRPVELVPTDEVGPVEENAQRVLDALRRHEQVALFSASKGSADVRAALEAAPELGARARLWIDLVGVIEGTPLAGEAGLPPATASSLSPEMRRAGASGRRLPATRAVHVAAFPRVAEVSGRARPAFERLRAVGATDGYVLLDAYRRAPGRVLVLRGTDHYLRGVPDLAERWLALLDVLLAELEGSARPAR